MKKTDTRIEKLHSLELKCLEVLDTRFDSTKGLLSLQDEDEANDAIRVLGIISRSLATERVKDATQFAVVKAISQNQEMLESYLRVSLPHLTPAKLASRPKKIAAKGKKGK